MRRADASGSTGSSTTYPASTLLASTPAAAMTRPCCVWTMRVSPRGVCFVATTRAVSASMASSRERAATTRPSDFDTTLLVITTMSPSARPVLPSGHVSAEQRSASRAPRSSPSRMIPMPSTAQAWMRVMDGRAVRRRPRGWPRRSRAVASTSVIIVGTAWQRMPAASTSGDARGVGGVDEPGVDEAAVGPGAVVQRRRRRPRSRPRWRVRQASAMPRTGAPPTMGETPTTGARVAAHGVGDRRAPAGWCRSRRPGCSAGRGRRRPT